MESVQKKGYVIHKLEASGNSAVKPDKRQAEPFIQDEEAVKRRTGRIISIGRLSVALLVVLCWELFTRIGLMDSYYWSSPLRILSTTWTQIMEGTLLEDIAYTSSSTILGFIGGTLLGSLLGLSFWWSKRFAGISEPFLILLNAMPKLALAPVLVILLGIGFFSKVALAFAMTVVVAALSAHSGVQSVDKDMEKLMYSLGAKRHQVFTKVVIPWAMPWMISSLRINIALSLAGAIVGEFIASSHGIGRMVIYAGTILDINLVWVGVVVLSVLSMVMYAGVVLLEKWLSKGYGMKKA
ncbi:MULTISPECIES: ABC transporter permease [Paenibacillus]|uniref:ABC transporter permease n=1 Tax=Paenibacillus borealis TaxID=160799 RepID=A0ABX3HF02_PAEBO|nr:ABC transporter permease [Paenibacillus borealis]OMD49101.1 ABC transporter permease [Paenibacillus borealis]